MGARSRAVRGRPGDPRRSSASRNERQGASTSAWGSVGCGSSSGSIRSTRFVTPRGRTPVGEPFVQRGKPLVDRQTVPGGSTYARDGDGEALLADRHRLGHRLVVRPPARRGPGPRGRLVPAQLRLEVEDVREDFLLVLAHPALPFGLTYGGSPSSSEGWYPSVPGLLNPTFGYGHSVMATLVRLSVTPVKALRLSHPREAEVTEHGSRPIAGST